jgi:signal transduction histidine kinase
VPVSVEADGVGRYAPEIEAALYFCTLEALNNVVKYARASRATVRLNHDDGRLAFEVTDDGCGFDPKVVQAGTGLQGMHDRLEALGGSLEVRLTPGEGTAVAGHVPGPASS